MNNLIKGEIYKLRKSKYSIGVIFLTLAIAVYSKQGWDFREAILSINRPIDSIYGIESISYAFGQIRYTSFIFALLAGEFIAKDFKNSNISKTFIYGYKRSNVIISKLIVVIPFFLLLKLLYLIILVAYASKNNGFCEVLDFNTKLYLIRLIVVGMMYTIAVISIITMVAIIGKSYFYTIALPFIFLMTYNSENIYLSYLMANVAGMNAMEVLATQSEVIKSIIVSTVTFIITIGGSLLYLKYSDIK